MGELIWIPPPDVLQSTEIGRFVTWLREQHGLMFDDQAALHRWSINDQEAFWQAIWDYFGVRAHARAERVLASDAMPGARWFPGAQLNYAEHLIGREEDFNAPAIIARSQTRGPSELTFGELREQIARARAGLHRLGVRRGDRVVAFLPNIPETLIAFAATASLGAIWASCAPELGARSVIDRLGQLEPKVLLSIAGYGYRDRRVDRRDEVAAIRAALPSLAEVVEVPYPRHELTDALAWDDLLQWEAPLEFDPVAFDHPLYVLFSSGTTGKPKAIIHGHGGILLEHLKAHALSWEVQPGGRLLWFTTTTWMMWNSLVSALLLRSAVVMIDGDPGWPSLDASWELAAETATTVMGVSPAFVMACRREGIEPGRVHDLSSVRALATAGSPMPDQGYRWLADQIPGARIVNGSGGTDVCTAIVTGSAWQPVEVGEIAGPALGVAACAFDQHGEEVVGELGELVITRPMPSMPVGFWGDDDGTRYCEAYFDHFPGVWRHGDWIRFSPAGTCVVSGRSDATLNRGGVRLGTGEFYSVVEDMPEIAAALVVHLEDESGGPGQLLLFVELAAGAELDDGLRSRIGQRLRGELSPRHVPDAVVAVRAIPQTLTGKKLETPVKRILRGAAPDEVASRDALRDPSALEAFAEYARAEEAGAR